MGAMAYLSSVLWFAGLVIGLALQLRYPVDWVYVRRRLPVEVIGEFDTWRQIRIAILTVSDTRDDLLRTVERALMAWPG